MEQERQAQQLIRDKTPDQIKLPYALWSRRAVAGLITDRFGICVPVRTMGAYLKRWGLMLQKPIWAAYEQSPMAVKRWMETDYLAIAARGGQEGAKIHWDGETGLRSNDVRRGRCFAPKDETPMIRVSSKCAGLSIISAVANKRQMRGKIFDGSLNADILIDFLCRLIKWVAKQALARTKLQPVKAASRHLRSIQKNPNVFVVTFSIIQSNMRLDPGALKPTQ